MPPAVSPRAIFSAGWRNPRGVTKEFVRKATGIDFAGLRFHDLRGSHKTALLDKGVPVHVVAARCGHDPAVLLRSYAKRTKKGRHERGSCDWFTFEGHPGIAMGPTWVHASKC
jgi:integrase